MVALLGAVFLVIGFVVLLERFALVSRSRDVIALSRNALATVRNPALDDIEKETILQSHAKRLFAHFFLITIGAAAALLLPASVIWLLDLAGAASFDDVMNTALSWQFISASAVLMVVYFIYRARRRS